MVINNKIKIMISHISSVVIGFEVLLSKETKIVSIYDKFTGERAGSESIPTGNIVAKFIEDQKEITLEDCSEFDDIHDFANNYNLEVFEIGYEQDNHFVIGKSLSGFDCCGFINETTKIGYDSWIKEEIINFSTKFELTSNLYHTFSIA